MDSTKYSQVSSFPEYPKQSKYEEYVIPVKNVPRGDPQYYNPFKVRNQMIINSIQIFLMLTYVWYTKGTEYSQSVAETFILIHSGTTITLMLAPELADHKYTRNIFLFLFIISDTYTVHILSNSTAIKGRVLELIFFIASAMKSIYYVDKVFYSEFERAIHPTKPRIDASELVLSLMNLGLILFLRGYSNTDRTTDLIWACGVFEILALFHWYQSASHTKSQVLESIIGYGFIISESFILDATWPSFWIFDVIIFFGYIPRVLAYLGYENCFQSFKEWAIEWIVFFGVIINQYFIFSIGGILMILSALWGVYTEDGIQYLNIHRNLVVFILLIEASLNVFLGVRPEGGRNQYLRIPCLVIFVICESYTLAYFCSLYRNATSFLILFLPLTIARNIIFIRDKFVGPNSRSGLCGGLTLINGSLRIFEGFLILLIILNLHFGALYYTNYNFLLSALIINLFILLQIMLTPENASKPPMNYFLMGAYVIMEAYTIAVFSQIIWVQLQSPFLRSVGIASIVYCYLEKTATYTKIIEPAQLSELNFAYNDDGELTTTEEYKEATLD